MMEEHSALILAEAILKQWGELIGERLGATVALTHGGEVAGADEVTTLLASHGVVLRADWNEPELCAVALFALADAQKVSGSDVTEDKLEESATTLLKETFSGALSTGLRELGAESLATPQIVIESNDAWTGESLLEELGGDASVVAFAFEENEGASGRGVLVLDDRMGAFPGVRGSAMPTLSSDELNDILGGEADDPADAAAAPSIETNGKRESSTGNIDMVLDIRLLATARLGRIEMPISEILELGPGSIVEVGHLVDEPVDLFINDKLIARGDVVVVDEKFGLRITEIISPRERIESLR